ncbi:MAG: tetratricopeptide repeat protein [Proteobacteria bacterium]|nr:tetratricopeptide repeat protein [Pseudomonadota bacterium]
MAIVFWRSHSQSPTDSIRPQTNPPPAAQERARDSRSHAIAAYVGSSLCRDCHPTQYSAWRSSHHVRAMAPATPDSVRGDFAGAVYRRSGSEMRFSVDGDQLRITIDAADGTRQHFGVAYSFGFTPLQQYLIPFPDGRLQVFPVAWDVAGKRWFHLHGSGAAKPVSASFVGEGLHWRGVFGNWNVMCATCHSTDLRKNYDPESDSYATSWAEISVGCEACHGPGQGHLQWAKNPDPTVADRGLIEPAQVVDRQPFPLDAGAGQSPQAVPSVRRDDEIAVCGPCHSRRQAITEKPVFGEPLLDHYVPELLRPGLYYADGQIQDEVFVLGSFLQSVMHRRGVLCSTCHDVHSGGLVVPESQLCTRCHPAPVYATVAHHFHEPGSDGARCVSCHMPERTYMGVDPRRDHSFRVPRPDLSETLGTPDPCTGCHSDKSAAWAAQAITAAKRRRPRLRLRGQAPDSTGLAPTAARKTSPGEILAAGRRGTVAALSALIALAGDDAQAAIVRATAIELLAQYPPVETEAAIRAALSASQPLIRVAAAESTAAWPPRLRFLALAPLLEDPVRAVRIQAARGLVDLEARFGRSPALDAAYRRALDEYIAAQRANLDHPGGRLNLATLYHTRGDGRNAAREYRAALQLDPGYVPAAVNLAGLLEGQGQLGEAAAVLDGAFAHSPDSGQLHYALGLVLAADHKYQKAADHLKAAIERLPPDPRLTRNYQRVLEQIAGQGGQ